MTDTLFHSTTLLSCCAISMEPVLSVDLFLLCNMRSQPAIHTEERLPLPPLPDPIFIYSLLTHNTVKTSLHLICIKSVKYQLYTEASLSAHKARRDWNEHFIQLLIAAVNLPRVYIINRPPGISLWKQKQRLKFRGKPLEWVYQKDLNYSHFSLQHSI